VFTFPGGIIVQDDSTVSFTLEVTMSGGKSASIDMRDLGIAFGTVSGLGGGSSGGGSNISNGSGNSDSGSGSDSDGGVPVPPIAAAAVFLMAGLAMLSEYRRKFGTIAFSTVLFALTMAGCNGCGSSGGHHGHSSSQSSTQILTVVTGIQDDSAINVGGLPQNLGTITKTKQAVGG
jgi:hypothetical protein